MKHAVRFLSIVWSAALLCGLLSVPAAARDLEVCRLCGGAGTYRCGACGDSGHVTCDACGGAGKRECPGEEGKGKCDRGSYLCPGCGGDGKNRSGDGQIIEGVCGQCGGAGRLTCIRCRGAGECACERCGGEGRAPCRIENCAAARAIGGKCPRCKGTGYILVGNPMPPASENDGTRNRPRAGDHIVTDSKTWAGYTYGASDGGQTAPPSDGGQTASPAEGEPETGGEDPSSAGIPVPADRESDFDLPIPGEDPASSVRPAHALRVEVGKMTDGEARIYASLPREELEEILRELQTVVASVKPGFADPATAEALSSFAAQNGYETLEEGRLFPITFAESRAFGFPVRVTVGVERGLLPGGTDLFVYRLTGSGDPEAVGKADYTTYDDGSVASVSFSTAAFSVFFTSSREPDTASPAEPDAALGAALPSEGGAWDPAPVLIASVAVLLVGGGAGIALALKKRRK